jgi:HK97 family phage portal protein
MGVFSRIFGGKREAALPAPVSQDEEKSVDLSPELWAAINGGWGIPTKSGTDVSTVSALQVPAFFRGVMVIADGVAQLPVEIYRTLPSGKGSEPAVDHPLYDLLLHQASELQDSFQFFTTVLMHAAATGNAVAYKVVVADQVRELIPIRPESVSIDLTIPMMRKRFDVTFENGGYASLGADDVFHLCGPSWRPFKGLDPAVVGREAIGLARATEESQARLHSNGVRASGMFAPEGNVRLTKEQVDVLREQIHQTYGGLANAMKSIVSTGAMKYTPFTMTGVDAQHLETRKHQIEEICRVLGVFPIMVGHAGDQSPTFASAEAFFDAHVRYTLQRWIKALRSAINTQLLTQAERREGYHVRIDTSELTRGSLEARTRYYQAALGTNSNPGWLTPNEVREDDGWNPEESLDHVMSPLTMAPAKDRSLGALATDRGAGQVVDGEKSIKPRTLYVSRKLLNADEFLDWAKAQGFASTLAADDLHVTIAYSRAPIDWMLVGEEWAGADGKGELIVAPGGPRAVEPIGQEGPVALKFASWALTRRNHEIREAGASWDWPEYQPHVTITYDAGSVDLSKVEPFRGSLRFGPEIFAEIDENWKPRAD